LVGIQSLAIPPPPHWSLHLYPYTCGIRTAQTLLWIPMTFLVKTGQKAD
jgi:hypothetical protein